MEGFNYCRTELPISNTKKYSDMPSFQNICTQWTRTYILYSVGFWSTQEMILTESRAAFLS